MYDADLHIKHKHTCSPKTCFKIFPLVPSVFLRKKNVCHQTSQCNFKFSFITVCKIKLGAFFLPDRGNFDIHRGQLDYILITKILC